MSFRSFTLDSHSQGKRRSLCFQYNRGRASRHPPQGGKGGWEEIEDRASNSPPFAGEGPGERSGLVEEVEGVGAGDGLAAGLDVQLGVKLIHIPFDRAHADDQA